MSVFMKRDRFPLGELSYIELDYIESTGTQNNEMQYIDTGFKPNQDTKVVIDVQGTQSGTLGRFYYGTDNSTSERFMFGKGSGSSWVMSCYYKNTNINIGTWDESIFKQRKTIIHDKNKMIVDGIEFSTTYATFQLPYNMYLFCDNYRGDATNHCSMRLFSCQIYDNDILVRDYIPVKMKESGEIGLWDIVNKVFYGNAGTGTFIAGEVAA